MKNNNIFQKKFSLVQKAISDNKNSALFKYFDNLLVNKRFDIAKEMAHIEQILTLDTYNLNIKEVIQIINDFIDDDTKNWNLFNIIKISNLPDRKIINSISKAILLKLGEKLNNVSRETDLIGVDFSVLRILDNFIYKIKDASIKSKYQKIKKSILIKLLSFDYILQKNELESVYTCWIDRVLNAVMQHEFDIKSFIKLNNKLLKIIPENLNLYWKLLQTINYLCFQPEFDDVNELRKFKRGVLKQIKVISEYQKINQNDVENILINTLADPTINKEKFYNLFSIIKKLSECGTNEKLFCFNIFDYLIYIDKKQNIFSHRFIREAFFTTVYGLIEKDDNIEMKEKELFVLLKLFHINLFFYYNKKDIIEKISDLLCELNKSNSSYKFYKCLDIADFIFTNNKDIATMDFIEKISKSGANFKKIYNRFSLYFA